MELGTAIVGPMTPEPTPIEIDERRQGTRPCPVCGVAMHVERKERVEVDVCAEHGVWLDRGSLEEITKAVRRKTQAFDRSLRRVAVEKAKKEGRISGSAFGWVSLLFG